MDTTTLDNARIAVQILEAEASGKPVMWEVNGTSGAPDNAWRKPLTHSSPLDHGYHLRIVAILEPGWVPWYGGDCQLVGRNEVELRFRRGTTAIYGLLGDGGLRWSHHYSGGDIIAYRVIPPAVEPFVLGRSVNGFTLGEGQEWHRQDWTREMLPEGWRPLLLNERRHAGCEMESHDGWTLIESDVSAQEVRKHFAKTRTQRPLPPVATIPVPEGWRELSTEEKDGKWHKGAKFFSEVSKKWVNGGAGCFALLGMRIIVKVEPPVKWQVEREAFARGEKIEYRHPITRGKWALCSAVPGWFEGTEYRVFDPYRELKEAHAAGRLIQRLDAEYWITVHNPAWSSPVEKYRIKPDESDSIESRSAPVNDSTLALGGLIHWRDLANQLSDVWLKCSELGATLHHDGDLDEYSTTFSVVLAKHGGCCFHGETPALAWDAAHTWLVSPDRPAIIGLGEVEL